MFTALHILGNFVGRYNSWREFRICLKVGSSRSEVRRHEEKYLRHIAAGGVVLMSPRTCGQRSKLRRFATSDAAGCGLVLLGDVVLTLVTRC